MARAAMLANGFQTLRRSNHETHIRFVFTRAHLRRSTLRSGIPVEGSHIGMLHFLLPGLRRQQLLRGGLRRLLPG
jgi:hypothetical protein